MIDRTTPLQLHGRIADRHVEARARRLEREATAAHGTAPAHERAIWLTDKVHAMRVAAGAVLEKVGTAGVRRGPSLTAHHYRA